MAQTLTLGKLVGPFVETDLGDDGSRSSRWVDVCQNEEGVDGFSDMVCCDDVGSDGFGGFDGLNGSGSEDGDSLSYSSRLTKIHRKFGWVLCC